MVDEVDNKTSEPEESSGPAAGERLAAARRELNISVDEIAKELHLDEAKVRALERNDGRRAETARRLGIGERTLYRKIKEYGLK